MAGVEFWEGEAPAEPWKKCAARQEPRPPEKMQGCTAMAGKKKKNSRMPAGFMKLGGLLASEGIRAWMSTLDYRAVFYDRTVDPTFGIGGNRIYIFWHENILIPLYLRGHCN